MKKALAVAALVFMAGGLIGCAEAVRQKTDMLSAAGFRIKLADTAEKARELEKLPPNRFTITSTPTGKISYLFPEPEFCKCLYYGDEKAYGAYQRIAQAQRLADKRLMAARMERDISWRWGVWGPGWGPYGWYY